MLSASALLGMIRTWESSSLECKSVRVVNGKVKAPDRDSLSDEIAAFANHEGGTLILGVDEPSRQPVGMDASDVSALVSFVSEICKDSIEPPLTSFFVDSAQIPDATGESTYLVYVEVRQSLWLHKSKGGYFYRHSDGKQTMSTEHLLRVGQARSQARIIQFDEQAVHHAGEDSLSQDLCLKFVHEDDASALLKRRILVRRNGNLQASVAGILMCCMAPEEHLSNSYIRAVCYRGKVRDANYQLDAKDIQGPLDEQIRGAFAFVSRHAQTSASKHIGRVEHRQYSMRAVFEALVNAVVHRDYSIHGSAIRLFMFADRMEIFSPGRLPNNLSVDNIAQNQYTRNELLARLLSECSVEDPMRRAVERQFMLERRGEGVGIILRESEALAGRPPIYEQFDPELKLTIYAANRSEV